MSQDEKSEDELSRTELPLPEERYRKLGIASRATFFRWEREGLRILRVGGRRFIYPSEVRRFLEFKNSAATETAAKAEASERGEGAE